MLKGFGDIQSDLTGKAQALVGQLLMARNQLNSLVNSSDANVANQAQVLLNTQTDLESQLSTVNSQLSSGASLSIPDYATIGVFLVKAQAQVDAVNALAGGTSAPMGAEVPPARAFTASTCAWAFTRNTPIVA